MAIAAASTAIAYSLNVGTVAGATVPVVTTMVSPDVSVMVLVVPAVSPSVARVFPLKVDELEIGLSET